MVGLRARNKARTRAEIQRHALRLFREQGYANTTVDQIAEAAEITQSTFFRYFPAKEDVVLSDDYDERIVAAFHAQPVELRSIEALRRAIRQVYDRLPPEELVQEWERISLAQSVPEVRARAFDAYLGGIQMVAEVMAKRAGRQSDDPAVRTFAGALVGVLMSVMLLEPRTLAEYLALMDDALVQFEAGFEF